MTRYFKSDLQREMRRYLKERNNIKVYNHCAAEIYGTFMYLSEAEVRFLQLKCKMCKTEAEFEEFRKNHIIYDRATKRGAKQMIWRRDGRFANDFKSGFFDLCAILSTDLL